MPPRLANIPRLDGSDVHRLALSSDSGAAGTDFPQAKRSVGCKGVVPNRTGVEIAVGMYKFVSTCCDALRRFSVVTTTMGRLACCAYTRIGYISSVPATHQLRRFSATPVPCRKPSRVVTNSTSPFRHIVAAGAALWLVLWLVVVGAHNAGKNGWLHGEWPTPHPSRASATSMGAEPALNAGHRPALNAGHRQLYQDSWTAHGERFMTAVLPPSAGAFGTADAVAGSVLDAITSAQLSMPVDRSPPVAIVDCLVGQELLIRLCVSRR